MGGQLTSSAVSAIDYGAENSPGQGNADNLPKVFQDLGNVFQGNPGACWVSAKCYEPFDLIQKFIAPKTAAFPNLKVFFNTCVTSSKRDTNGKVIQVTAVQRSPKSGVDPWGLPLSEVIADWYSPRDSNSFTKKSYTFTGFQTIIEATELGDVLMTSGVPVHQGVEIPTEDGKELLDQCGQSNIFPFFMQYNENPPQNPWIPPPGCPPCTPPSSQGHTGPNKECCHYWVEQQGVTSWAMVWTYRRALATKDKSIYVVNPGDISQQNWGAQDSAKYIFLSLEEAKKQVKTGWKGGLNISNVKYSEQRAYGWFNYFVANATNGMKPYLFLNRTYAQTGTGLSKVPYLRDTRRSAAGIGGFRLLKAQLYGIPPAEEEASDQPQDPNRGYHFADTIGIGVYLYADIHPSSCVGGLPHYLKNHTIHPYYIPYRALTVEKSPNMLVAGKTMSQSFHANAGTRLHPEEWVSGTAAGAASALMYKYNLTTFELYQKVQVLQQLLEELGQPLEWKLK